MMSMYFTVKKCKRLTKIKSNKNEDCRKTVRILNFNRLFSSSFSPYSYKLKNVLCLHNFSQFPASSEDLNKKKLSCDDWKIRKIRSMGKI